MSVIFLKHPRNGTKVATSEGEAREDMKYGWTEYDPKSHISDEDLAIGSLAGAVGMTAANATAAGIVARTPDGAVVPIVPVSAFDTKATASDDLHEGDNQEKTPAELKADLEVGPGKSRNARVRKAKAVVDADDADDKGGKGLQSAGGKLEDLKKAEEEALKTGNQEPGDSQTDIEHDTGEKADADKKD